MKPSSKLAKRTAIAILGVIVAMGLSGCSNPLSKENNTATVSAKSISITTLTVKPENISTEIAGNGYILPAKTTSLYYNNLSGPLKKLYIKQNDQVKVGQPIAEIQVADLQTRIADQETIMKRWKIRISQLDEDINRAKASMKLANLNLHNAKKDKSTNSNYRDQLKLQYEISSSAYKDSKWNRELAQFDYDKDHKSLEELKSLVNQAVLKSPINGVAINMENLIANDMVASGLVIARIAEFKNMLFKLTLATSDAEYVSSDTNALLRINEKDYPVSVYTSQPGDQLGNDVNGQNFKNYVYLRFNKAIPSINTNELVDATLKVSKNQVLVLPKEAVYQEAGKNLVEIQYGKDIKTIAVTKGLETQDKVEIISGLKSGDKVIVR